jgi:hypothetical protein
LLRATVAFAKGMDCVDFSEIVTGALRKSVDVETAQMLLGVQGHKRNPAKQFRPQDA